MHYLNAIDIIRTVADATSDKIYVKLHPAQSAQRKAEILLVCNGFDHVEVSDHSIHDLTAVSDIVVTQNSAAGFEALMQKKPVITCGKADYHHATIIVKSVAALRLAIENGPDQQQSFPFEKYFYWFLEQNMLEPTKPDFADRAWTILRGPNVTQIRRKGQVIADWREITELCGFRGVCKTVWAPMLT